ncbi:MAG: hypothetical protein AABX30_02085 [Nanoarchaeota archaeon]
MIKQKRGLSTLGWILIIAAIVVVGVGLYFLLMGGSDGVTSIFGGGNLIPSPPALPD